ncbi:MAG: oligo-1,6-glucosidase [Acidimicrobiia bacterium]|nr:MAG: oligo-1,6-glucosidase [Acidimicrobiia bacterium]
MPAPADPRWWHTGVIYQIYPRSWADGNGDGVGDLPGIVGRLDHLVDLGVDAVWLSPFYRSPMADFGYDVSDHCDVDPLFGTLADFDRLLEETHRRGLKLIVDYVINHTSDRHPWFVESRSSRDNPKRDWYVWRDPAPDGGPPNNWIASFGGPAWTFDEATGQYYLHSFLPEQPDLNWRNPEVEEAMFDVVRFWLERGVDGFRIDVAHRAMKDPLLRDNPPRRGPAAGYKVEPEYASQEHIFDVAHPDVHLLFRRLRRLVDTYDDRFLVGEIHEYDWPVWGSYYGWELDELHMPFNFGLLPVGLDPDGIRRTALGIEAALPGGAWPNWVVGNHDEPRITRRLGWEGSKAAAVLLLTLRGTPTVYYGDEIGMAEADIPPERQQDPWGRRKPGYGRDGCRTPMQWEPGPNAGFCPPGVEPWLPVDPDPALTVAAQKGDPSSHLELYRRLIRVRKDRPALLLGDIEFPGWDPPNPLVYRRTHPDDRVVVALNLSDGEVRSPVGGRVLVGTHHDRWDDTLRAGDVLRPWEAVVLDDGS